MDSTSRDRGIDAAIMAVAADLARLRGHREVLKNGMHAPAAAPRDMLRIAMAFQSAAFDQPQPVLQLQALPAGNHPSDSINEANIDAYSRSNRECNYYRPYLMEENAPDTYMRTGIEPVNNLLDFVNRSGANTYMRTGREKPNENPRMSSTRFSAPREQRSPVGIMA